MWSQSLRPVSLPSLPPSCQGVMLLLCLAHCFSSYSIFFMLLYEAENNVLIGYWHPQEVEKCTVISSGSWLIHMKIDILVYLILIGSIFLIPHWIY